MLRLLLWSIKKSRRLRKISRELAGKPDFGFSIIQALANGERIESIVNKGNIQRRKLFDLIHEDPGTNKILKELCVSDEELNELYDSFIRQDAGVFRKGHWVPASSLAFVQTLEYAIKQRRKGEEYFHQACQRLVQYFDSNETGCL